MPQNPPLTSAPGHIAAVTERWLQAFVVELNLCPFARRELDADRVRISVTRAASVDALVLVLRDELDQLHNDSAIETSMLVHPEVLGDFLDYNDFLDVADGLLVELGYDGVFQIASFHPHYQFAGTRPDAPENFANRSPWQMLHLLRETSVTRAVESHDDIGAIPDLNMARLNEIGSAELEARWQRCFGAELPDD